MAVDVRIGLSVARAAFDPLVAYVNGLQVGLFKDATIPDEWEDLAAYDQPTNPGYELISPNFVPVDPLTGPVYHALSTPIAWEADDSVSQEFVFGWFAYDQELDQVVIALLYGSSEPFIRTGPFYIDADLSTFFTPFT